jgi:hypothetical protein
MKKYLTLIAAATLMAACSNEADQTEQQAEGQPIAVAVAEGGLTRATGEVSIPRQIADNGFGLFGCYTGQLTYENTSVSPDFMYNQKVNSPDKGETWEYYPLKYWPNSTNPGSDEYNEYISFFAYAPYEASPRDDGRCIFGMSNKYEKGDPWVNYRLAEDPWDDANPQVDLMYGVRYKSAGPNGSDLLFTDQKKPVINETMKFYFQHALACIGDKITIRLSDELYNRQAYFYFGTQVDFNLNFTTAQKVDGKKLRTKDYNDALNKISVPVIVGFNFTIINFRFGVTPTSIFNKDHVITVGKQAIKPYKDMNNMTFFANFAFTIPLSQWTVKRSYFLSRIF